MKQARPTGPTASRGEFQVRALTHPWGALLGLAGPASGFEAGMSSGLVGARIGEIREPRHRSLVIPKSVVGEKVEPPAGVSDGYGDGTWVRIP